MTLTGGKGSGAGVYGENQEGTVYGLCADKTLPHVRILNTIRIAPKDLEAFIAARWVGARPYR